MTTKPATGALQVGHRRDWLYRVLAQESQATIWPQGKNAVCLGTDIQIIQSKRIELEF